MTEEARKVRPLYGVMTALMVRRFGRMLIRMRKLKSRIQKRFKVMGMPVIGEEDV